MACGREQLEKRLWHGLLHLALLDESDGRGSKAVYEERGGLDSVVEGRVALQPDLAVDEVLSNLRGQNVAEFQRVEAGGAPFSN